MAGPDNNYQLILKQLVEKIKQSRQKLARIVNAELLTTYWEIGKTIIEQQKKEGWGKKTVERLAKDLKAEFPNMGGLSERNLVYMQTYAAAWPFFPFTQPPVADLPTPESQPDSPITQPPAAEFQSYENQGDNRLQPILVRVPWTHHMIILDKIKNEDERIFYIRKVIENNWTKNILKVNIDTNLYNRAGNAITNFGVTLPKDQSELARLMLKNPYVFDFLDIAEQMQERDLERALVKHIQRFLLELGKGFAYVGNQFNVKVENDEFVLDLLFFNYNLNCFVVFELKIGEFKSEYAGKLNFYVNTIDAQIKMPGHNLTIGVLLCKTPNKTVVKYALQGIKTPLGVTEYELMPKQLKMEMPTIEELEQELEKEIEIIRKPIDEKRNKLKEILARIKGDEIKKAKEVKDIIYLFEKVLLPLRKKVEELLKNEMDLFAKKYIAIRINDIQDANYTIIDLEAQLQKGTIWKLGLDAYFDGFKPAGVKTFGLRKDLLVELREYKYEIKLENANTYVEYLYHHEWIEEEIMKIAEQWSEQIIDEIKRRAESLV